MERGLAVQRTIELTERAAVRAMTRLESLVPGVGEPYDYGDCMLLGLWRRLDAGERIIPRSAMMLLEERGAAKATRPLRERSPQWRVAEADVGEFLAGIFLLRLGAILGGEPADEPVEEEMMVGEGLTLALLTPREAYARAPAPRLHAARPRGLRPRLGPFAQLSRIGAALDLGHGLVMISTMKVELERQGGVLGLDKQVRIMDGVLQVTEHGSVRHKRRVTAEQSQAIEEAAAGLPKPPTRIRATDSVVSDAMDTYLSIESERGERLRYVLAPGRVDPALDNLVGMIDAAELAASNDAS